MRKLRRLLHTFCWILDYVPSHWVTKNSTKYFAIIQSISLQSGHKPIALHWVDQVLKIRKYNSGIQQICFVLKAQPHTHKVAERHKGRWVSPNWYSVFVCLLGTVFAWAGMGTSSCITFRLLTVRSNMVHFSLTKCSKNGSVVMMEKIAWIPSNLCFPLACNTYWVFTAEYNFWFGVYQWHLSGYS